MCQQLSSFFLQGGSYRVVAFKAHVHSGVDEQSVQH